MRYYVGNMPVGDDELYHYGTKGMRWGQRRFQNRDGSLTAAGRLRYGWGRARKGARRAYGQARRSYKKANNWYQRNKKTIGRVAIGAGVAAAGAVGFRNRKAIARAAKVLGGKAFPAGTRRAQLRSRLRYNVGNFGTKANRGVSSAADTLKRKARIRSQVNSAMFTGRVRDTTSRFGASARRTADNISRTKIGQRARSVGVKAKGAAGKSADYIRRTPSRISAKKVNSKLARAQGNFYKKTGIVGDRMTKGQKRFIDAQTFVARKASDANRKARETAKTIGASARTKASNVKRRAYDTASAARTKVSNKTPQRVKDVATNVRVRANEARFRRSQRATARDMNRQALNTAKEIYGTKSTRKAKKLMRSADSAARRGRARAQGKDYQRVSRVRYAYDRARMNPKRAAGRALIGTAGTALGVSGGAYYYGRRRKKKSRR